MIASGLGGMPYPEGSPPETADNGDRREDRPRTIHSAHPSRGGHFAVNCPLANGSGPAGAVLAIADWVVADF
jgi:hypothetical protein